MSGRGEFTDEVRKYMERYFGRESSVKELRLIPYIHYVMTNDQRVQQGRLNDKEKAILSQWKEEGQKQQS